MKLIIFKLFFVLAALLASVVSSAGGVGNGGFVLKCYYNSDGSRRDVYGSESDMEKLI